MSKLKGQLSERAIESAINLLVQTKTAILCTWYWNTIIKSLQKQKKKKKKKKKVTFAVSDRCDVIKKTEDVGQVNRFFASQIIEAS